MICRLCGVELPLIRFFDRTCSDDERERCRERQLALEDPPEVTPDPDLEPPEDLDLCSHCKGKGFFYTSQWPDWETGRRRRRMCEVCGGSRMQPVEVD